MISLDGEQRGADHIGRRFVNAAPRRRVAGVEVALAGDRAIGDQVEIFAACERIRVLRAWRRGVSMMRTRLSRPRAANSA